MADNTVKVKIEGDATGAVAAANSVKNAITGLSSHAAGAVGGFASLAAGATKELAKIGVTAGTVAATVTSALAFKGLKANAQFEDYNVQFATLIKNSKDFAATYPNLTSEQDKFAKATELAGDKMKDLAKFGAETPFELPQVVEAQKILMGFGLASQDTAKRFGKSSDDILRIAGDVASGTGASFQEIALDMGKFSSGATGEAISRFQELGIVTRRELEDMGLKFTKSGELIVNSQEDMDKATSVVFNAMQKKFGGLMDAQSQTFNGILSNIKDNIGLWMREVSKPIFEPLKNGLNDVYNFMSSDAGKKAMEKLQGYVQEGVDKIAAIFKVGRDAIITFKAALNGDWANANGINPFVAKIGEFGLVLKNNVIPAVKEFYDKIKPIASTLFDLYRTFSPVLLAFDTLRAFMTGGSSAAIDLFISRIQAMGEVFGLDLTGAVQNVIGFFQTTLIPVFQQVADFVMTVLVPAFQQFAGWVGTNILPIFESMGNTFVTTILPALQNLGQFVMTNIVPAMQEMFNWISTNVVPALERLANFIATTVVPVMGNIAAFVIDTVIPALTKIGEVIMTVVTPVLEGLGNFIGTVVLPALKEIGDFIEQNVIPALRNIWQWVDQNVMPVLKTLAEYVGGFLKSAMEGYGQVVGTVWNGIKGAISMAWDTISGIFTTIKNVLQTVGDAFNTLKNGISTAWDGIKNVVSTAWDTISGIFDKIVGVIKGAFQQAWDGLKTAIGNVWDGIKGAATSAWEVLSGIFNKIKDAVLDIPNKLKDMAQQIWDWITKTAGEALSKAAEIGRNIINGIVNGVKEAPGKIWDGIKGAVGSAWDGLTGFLGMHSPSKLFAYAGEMMMEGLALGVDSKKSAAIEELQKAVTAMADVMTKGAEAFKALNSYSAVNQTVMNQFMSDVNNTMVVFTGVAGQFKSEGLKSAGEFADAASKMTSLVGSGVNGLMELSKYSAISNDQMNQFFLDLTNTMIVFGERAKNFDDKGLQASGLFADAAGKVVGIIGNAVQGFTALADFKGVPPAAIQALVDGISYTVELATVAAGKMETDMMVQVGVFGEAVGKLFNGFKSAIDTFAGLEKFKATPSNVIRAFISELEFTVSLASDLAAKADKDMIAETGKFSEAVGKIFTGLKSAMDLFKSLETFKGYPADAIKKLMDGIRAAIVAMADTNKQVDAFLIQAEHFADTIAAAVGKINAGLADLKSLSGISVSANVTVGGAGVPAKALGGLASGLTLWGEQRPELADVPGRGLMLASAPTLSNFPSGTRVYSGGETKQIMQNMGGVTINVYAAPGMNEHMVAQLVEQKLDEKIKEATQTQLLLG